MVKTASSKRKYFNCTLQAENDPVKAVCYSPEKHSQLEIVAKTKSPVKLQNFKRTDSSKDIVITKFTKITPLDKDEVAFHFQEDMTVKSADTVVNISSIAKLAPEQLISVKAQVVSVSATKHVAISKPDNTGTIKVPKQDLVIRDTTASIRVVLWGKYVDIAKPNVTYLFKHLRLKSSKFDRYLNTPKTDPFILTECEEFQQPLVHVDEEIKTSSTVQARIIGIQDATKTMACVSCQRRVVPKETTSQLGICQSQSCRLNQPISKCPVQWILKVRVLTTTEPTMKLLLTMPHDTIEDLVLNINPAFNLTTTSDDELIITILEADKLIQFTYDNFNKVSQIAIQ